MNSLKRQFDEHLDSLALLCCETLAGDRSELDLHKDPLLRELARLNFQYQRNSLSAVITSRVAAHSPALASRHPQELKKLTAHLEERFLEYCRKKKSSAPLN